MQLHKQPAPADTESLRRQKRTNFLAAVGLGHVEIEPMQADASFRRYYRLRGGDKPMLLMEDPPDRPPVPPFVMVEPFIYIAEHLRSLGLRSPLIYHGEIENGLLVIEDFGDDTYTRLFNAGEDPKPLYELAIDTLVHLHRHEKCTQIELPPYDAKHLLDEAMLLLDWYVPRLTGVPVTEEAKQSYAAVWQGLFAAFPAEQKTLVLRDYHVDNLMRVSGAEGIAACGLLDFQDALIGHPAYDLMSLLEDARRDVPEDLQQHLYDRYMKHMDAGFDRAGFDVAYGVLAAQRHAKILGIFVRLLVRDGKDRYMKYIPHVHRLFLNALAAPALAPLKTWFEENRIAIEKGLPQ